jgi:glycosyltransferase involved in cell wall biosynthesis
MKIIVVGYSILDLQLAPRSVMRMLAALAGRGHDVTWIVASMLAKKEPSVPGLTIDAIRLRKNRRILSFLSFQLLAMFKILRSIGRFDALIADVDSLYALLPILLILRFSARHSPGIFLRVQTNPVDTGGRVHTLIASFLYALSIKISAAVFDKIFFISPMLGELACTQLKIPSDKIAVWPSAVDLAIFSPDIKSKTSRLRSELGLEHTFVALYHGVISRSRGAIELTRAFETLKRRSARTALILLGEGQEKGEISKYVSLNGLEDTIKVLASVDQSQVAEYIGACDAGIVPLPDTPAWRYQCPIKVLEVLAINKPLLVSDIPCHRWLLDSSPIAYFFKGTSADEIANGVEEFMKSMHSMHQSNCEAARKIACEFSTDRVAQKIESEVLGILDRSVSAAQ